MKTTTMTVEKLYGRCLLFRLGAGTTIEVKVMGDRELASPARELLLIALEAAGITMVDPPKAAPTKGGA